MDFLTTSVSGELSGVVVTEEASLSKVSARIIVAISDPQLYNLGKNYDKYSALAYFSSKMNKL
jgi:hypothetical protein